MISLRYTQNLLQDSSLLSPPPFFVSYSFFVSRIQCELISQPPLSLLHLHSSHPQLQKTFELLITLLHHLHLLTIALDRSFPVTSPTSTPLSITARPRWVAQPGGCLLLPTDGCFTTPTRRCRTRRPGPPTTACPSTPTRPSLTHTITPLGAVTITPRAHLPPGLMPP